MSATKAPIVDVFKEFARLHELRTSQRDELSPELEAEWNEVRFTVESIFSGMYASGSYTGSAEVVTEKMLRDAFPVEYVRVPTEADVLCETTDDFFSGRLQDISTGGAYLSSSVPLSVDSRVRLTFCTFRQRLPMELEGRVAWSNPSSVRKSTLPQGAGVQFTHRDPNKRSQLKNYVLELVEGTLSRASLL